MLCTTFYEYDYAPYASDVRDGAKLVESGVWEHNFVQTEECDGIADTYPDDATREELPECVTYHEIDTYLWVVTVSGKPVQAASADDGALGADQPQQSNSKHSTGVGKHRGNGKHRK